MNAMDIFKKPLVATLYRASSSSHERDDDCQKLYRM